MRLVKYLAHAGVASRRASEKMIAEGRVKVDGSIMTDPARDVTDDNAILVDGKAIEPEIHETWVLNKPVNVTSTAREPGKRLAVVELVPSRARLYPVGRLDVDSTGLILLTNDGELANILTHPRFEIPKTYKVKLARRPTDTQLRRLREGVQLEDGITHPAKVRKLTERSFELTISEGRNRQIRRMAEAVDNRVVGLERIAFGPLKLGDLPNGKARKLRPPEVVRLWKDVREMAAEPGR